jgi:hypothetical protein
MAEISAKFQLFGITLLLATPSELHHVWLEQNQDWPTIAAKLKDLGFSDEAIASAKTNIHDPMTNALKQTFTHTAQMLQGDSGLPIYDAGMHPMKTEAMVITSALRSVDGAASHLAAAAGSTHK